jgi:hypothetical protein
MVRFFSENDSGIRKGLQRSATYEEEGGTISFGSRKVKVNTF